MQPSLHQLRLLVAVAEEGGVSRAAARLHLTQPTLSIQLKQLAHTVGEPLFEQVGRRLYLTDAGHEVLAAARGIEDQLAALQGRLAARRGMQQGRLRISVVSTAEYFMPRILGEFQRAHPGIDVALHVLNRADLVKRVESNADDLYLMTRPPDDPAIRAESVGRNPLVVVAAPSHPWARRHRIPVKELATQPFVVREAGSGTRLWADDWLRGRRVTIQTRLELGSNEAVKQAVRGGFGLAIVSAHALLLEAEQRLIVPLDVQGFPIPSRWHLVTRIGKPLSPVADGFRLYARKQAMPQVTQAVEAAVARLRARGRERGRAT